MAKPVWVVLPDPFPTRVFVDCGIVAGLADELPGAVEIVLALPEDEARSWLPTLGTVPVSRTVVVPTLAAAQMAAMMRRQAVARTSVDQPAAEALDSSHSLRSVARPRLIPSAAFHADAT